MPMHLLITTVAPTVLCPMALYRVALFGLALYARVRWNITAEDVALLLRASKLMPGQCICSVQRRQASCVEASRAGHKVYARCSEPLGSRSVRDYVPTTRAGGVWSIRSFIYAA